MAQRQQQEDDGFDDFPPVRAAPRDVGSLWEAATDIGGVDDDDEEGPPSPSTPLASQSASSSRWCAPEAEDALPGAAPVTPPVRLTYPAGWGAPEEEEV